MAFRRTCLALCILALAALPLLAQEAPAPTPTPAPAPESAPAPAPVAAATTAPAPAPTPVTPRAYFEEIVLVLEGQAETNGAIGVEFLAVGGEPKGFVVKVLAKSRAKEIAEDIHKELTLAAGAAYKVRQSGGEVSVKKQNKKAPNVSIVVTQLAVPGVSALVKKG